MLTKFNDIDSITSNAIHSCIQDGYHIDSKESVIDHEKDKDCTFKAVLKKDVDGIECKTVITLSNSDDDKNKCCTYHKVETVGDTKWSEETRIFKSNFVDNDLKDNNKLSNETNSLFVNDDSVKTTDCHDEDDCKEDDIFNDWLNNNKSKLFSDILKITNSYSNKSKDKHGNTNKNCTLDQCDECIKANNKTKNIDDKIDDTIDKIKENSVLENNMKSVKQNKYENEFEDSLIKLVRFIFGN